MRKLHVRRKWKSDSPFRTTILFLPFSTGILIHPRKSEQTNATIGSSRAASAAAAAAAAAVYRRKNPQKTSKKKKEGEEEQSRNEVREKSVKSNYFRSGITLYIAYVRT